MEFLLKQITLILVLVMISLSPLQALAESPLMAEVSDEYFGGNKATEDRCNKVLEQSKSDDKVRETDVFKQCQAYNAAMMGYYVDLAMIAIDAFTAGICTYACVASPTIESTLACNAVGTFEGAADVTAMTTVRELTNQDWSGMDYASTVMGVVGTFAGAGGVAAGVKSLKATKGVKAVGGAAK